MIPSLPPVPSHLPVAFFPLSPRSLTTSLLLYYLFLGTSSPLSFLSSFIFFSSYLTRIFLYLSTCLSISHTPRSPPLSSVLRSIFSHHPHTLSPSSLLHPLQHELVVTAEGGGAAARVLVLVRVADVNDNAPEFVRPAPRLTIIEEDDRDLPATITRVRQGRGCGGRLRGLIRGRRGAEGKKEHLHGREGIEGLLGGDGKGKKKVMS